LLVAKKDYENLARKAVSLLENDELAQKIISSARRECVKYSLENVRGEWVKLYQNLVS
jgi:glycosyltransferase involved in cell wall biosynthesis